MSVFLVLFLYVSEISIQNFYKVVNGFEGDEFIVVLVDAGNKIETCVSVVLFLIGYVL